MQTDNSVGSSDAACSDSSEVTVPASPRSTQEQTRAALIRTIEGAIIPRLMMINRSSRLAPIHRCASAGTPEPFDVAEFTRLLLAHGPGIGCEFVETLRQQGASFDRIYLGLIAPAARRLVDLWEERNGGPAELSLALSALHAVLLEVSGAARSERSVSRGQ